MTGSVRLHGGGSAISVELSELAGYAELLRQAGFAASRAVLSPVRRIGGDPAMLAAAALDPAGAALILQLLATCLALLAALVTECGTLAGLLRAAEHGYAFADRAFADQLDRRLRPAIEAGRRLPAALLAVAGQPGRIDLPAALTTDPELADLAVDLLAGAIAGPSLAALPGTTSQLAGLLATPYSDGRPVVTARPDLAGFTDDDAGPPRSTADLIRSLAVRVSTDDGGGQIDIRRLDSPVGRRVIVDITGTTIWNFDPRRPTPQASDLSTNLRSLANHSSVMQRGVVQALHRAGVGPNEPIMLVGHSQGGVVAARLASDLTASGEFRVTHLVTAGSPIGLVDVPDSVSVLALENDGDLVPQLDGTDNPNRPNWLTAQLDRGDPTIRDQHAIGNYLIGAADLDRCQDPAMVGWRATAAGFLSARSVHTQVFQIRRAE